MSTIVRICPKCKTERSQDEMLCKNKQEQDEKPCGYYLADETPFEKDNGSPKEEINAFRNTDTEFIEQSLPQNTCQNGHPLDPGDLLCVRCSSSDSTALLESPIQTESSEPKVIDGWQLIQALSSQCNAADTFLAQRSESRDSNRYVLNIYKDQAIPDVSIYPILDHIENKGIAKLVAHGQSDGRFYEVWQERHDISLKEFLSEKKTDTLQLRDFVFSIGNILNELCCEGIRHCAITPSNIRIGSSSGTDTQLTGFSSAQFSRFDIEMCPLDISRYTAPEAIVGGLSAASDWWSLGLILLEIATDGKCFECVNEKAFQIHVVTRGIEVPDSIAPDLATLIDGLLQRDPSQRWQWETIQRWLSNEIPNRKPEKSEVTPASVGPFITLNEQNYLSPENFALAAAERQNWEAARSLLDRGAIATWLSECGAEERKIALVKTITSSANLSSDLKLALALLAVNQFMPLVIRGDIVNPAWLLANREDGYALVTGPANKRLQQLEREPWLHELNDRAKAVRKKIELLEIQVDASKLEFALLSTSQRNLEAQWANVRACFPDSEHQGILSLMERRSMQTEDLIILISADVLQFIPYTDILERASETAQKIAYNEFDPEAVRNWLTVPRFELYNELDKRLEDFSRCSIEILDDWADNYRLERRIDLDRALILVSVSPDNWKQPPKQQYLAHLLDFFQKKIVLSVQRGPLVKQAISKTTPAIDLTEIAFQGRTSAAILDHLLSRTDQAIEIDASLLSEDLVFDSRVRRLVKRTKDFKRETGKHGLFLGFPFIVYRTRKIDQSKTALRIAPLMLWPIRIESAVTSRGSITVAFEKELEEARLNPALETVLELDKKQLEQWEQCADDILKRNSINHKEILEAFAHLAPIPDRQLKKLPSPDTKVEVGEKFIASAGVIFNCDYSGKVIADDLQHMRNRPLTGTALERALRVSESEDFTKPATEATKLLDNFCVLASDPSQLEAVAMARGKFGLHIEGPPGTGKSQTIVNIIADSVSKGETVLVICEKQAALRIVEKRLTAENLGNRLCLISDPTKDRLPIIKELRSQVEANQNTAEDLLQEARASRSRLLVRLRSAEDEVNKQHVAFFLVDPAIGLSYRQIINYLITLENEQKYVAASQLRTILQSLNEMEVTALEESCAGVGLLWLGSKFETSALHVMKEFAVDEGIVSQIQDRFLEFVVSEEARKSLILKNPNSPNLEDILPLQQWLKDNLEHFTMLSDDERCRLSNWLELFRESQGNESAALQCLSILGHCNANIEKLNKSHHHEDLFRILFHLTESELQGVMELASIACRISESDETRYARWQMALWLKASYVELKDDGSTEEAKSAFAFFKNAEISRSHVYQESQDCFEIEDAEPILKWIKTNEDYFRQMPELKWKKLSELLPLFKPDSNKNSKGLALIRELNNIRAKILGLNPADHHEALFAAFIKMSSLELARLLEIGKAAASAESETEARWELIRFLRNANILSLSTQPNTELVESFSSFVEAEKSRIQVINQYPNAYTPEDLPKLSSWLEANSGYFERLEAKNRESLADFCELFLFQNKAGPKIIEDLERVKGELEILDNSYHDQIFSRAVAILDWKSLISLEKKTKMALNAKGILSVMNPFCLVAKWQLGKYFNELRSELTEVSLRQFDNAVFLEKKLIPVRDELSPVLANLRIDISNSAPQNLLELQNIVDENLAVLKEVFNLCRMIDNCPFSKELIDSIKDRDTEAIQSLFNKAFGSVKVYESRVRSKSKLTPLSRWFEKAWMQKQEGIIQGTDCNFAELKLTWDELPLMNEGTFALFLRAAGLETYLAPLRRSLSQICISVKLEDRISRSPISMLLPAVSALYKALSELSDAADRLYSWPDQMAARMLENKTKDFFEQFVARARGAIKNWEAKKKCFTALMALSPWFESAWIEQRKKLIAENQSDASDLEIREQSLTMLNRTVMQTVYNSVALELAVKPLRNQFKNVATILRVDSGNTVDLTVETLGRETDKHMRQLQNAVKSFEKLKNCPLADQAFMFARKASREDFESFVENANGSIDRAQARQKSMSSLDVLSEWFDENWIANQRSLVAQQRHNLDKLEEILHDLTRTAAFQQFRNRSHTLDPKVIDLLGLLRSQEKQLLSLEADDIATYILNTIRREACLSWKGRLELNEPTISLSSQEIRTKVGNIAEWLNTLTELNRQVLEEPDWNTGIASRQEWDDVTRYTGPRSRKLREFIERGTELGLMKIRPIWLMNPEVASRLLPLKQGLFDKVIFDEASQLRVEYALPALYRAKQAIVSGDDKQMPPSNYFASKVETGEDDDEEDDQVSPDLMTETQRLDREEVWNRKEIKDCPDLLTLASSILPSTRLEIHYRSEYRELISFSNAAFYGGSLSIPAKHPTSEILNVRPIEVVRVDSVYENQTNRGEAERIVQILREVWLRKDELPTIGVVSFNKKQADLIAAVLSEQADKEPEFAAALQREEAREEHGEDMGFFVKNLENVQGDERDVIIFSTTFGRDSNNHFRRNFGNLGQQGGERRLNVGITRAKRKVILVTSLPLHEISNCLSSNRSPATPRDYLQYYLHYATQISNGQVDQAHAAVDKLVKSSTAKARTRQTDPVISEIYQFIRAQGYEAEIGQQHGAFYLDVAIVDPKTNLFAIGIECDSPRHKLLESAYHREVWRQEVLKKSIKVIHRISSRDWYHEKTREQQSLNKLIQKIIN